jgi:hypothetical protein
MEAAVRGIIVLSLALATHDKVAHGGQRAIVGDVLNDSEARAAICAVDEGVAKAPILRVKQLLQAVVANTDVWGDQGVRSGLARAVNDPEPDVVLDGDLVLGDAFNVGQRWSLGGQFSLKFVQSAGRSLNFHEDAAAVIADEPGQTMPESQIVDEGTKSDALDNACHSQAITNASVSLHQLCITGHNQSMSRLWPPGRCPGDPIAGLCRSGGCCFYSSRGTVVLLWQ